MVSNVFIVHRNKYKERIIATGEPEAKAKIKDDADTRLICVKQRETGVEPTYKLWFHPQSCQFLERAGDRPKMYIQ